jgi:hypothetical protein
MQTTKRLAAILAAAGIAALSLSAVPAANAAQLESGSFEFSESNTFDECGYDVREDVEVSGKYTISKGTARTGGEFFRVKQQTVYHGTFTNVATGAYFTNDWHVNFREMPATIVDENGPIVTYQTKESGVWDTIRDSSGTVRYRSAGNLVFQYVFDTGGDGAPGGGEFLSEEFVRTSGNWQTWDADFCAIVDELIG